MRHFEGPNGWVVNYNSDLSGDAIVTHPHNGYAHLPAELMTAFADHIRAQRGGTEEQKDIAWLTASNRQLLGDVARLVEERDSGKREFIRRAAMRLMAAYLSRKDYETRDEAETLLDLVAHQASALWSTLREKELK